MLLINFGYNISEDKMHKSIFLTGATGNIGARILLDLLYDGTVKEIYLLVRGKSEKDAENRVRQTILKIAPKVKWHQVSEKVTVYNGDITRFQLGLSNKHYLYLQKHADYIIHGAATTYFDNTLNHAYRVNLHGTINVVQFASRAYRYGQLKRFGYISTAYVNGCMKEVIYEDRLQECPQFENTYEQSKYEAEKFVRSHINTFPLCIFRPSIVVGDSITGRTVNYNVLYSPLKMICSGLIDIIPGSPRARLNVVPVDYVASSIQNIMFTSDDVIGKTFNLVSDESKNMTIREIIDFTIKYAYRNNYTENDISLTFIPGVVLDVITPVLPKRLKRIKNLMNKYIPYMRKTILFDTTNTHSPINQFSFTPPNLKCYLEVLLENCFTSKWGRVLQPAA